MAGSLNKHTRDKWENAQIAEQKAWLNLWLPESSADRLALVRSEQAKGDFIFTDLAAHFAIDPKNDWKNLSVLDVGCGPLSLVARSKYGKVRAGVDPLEYPVWVYEAYDKNNFEVYRTPFEELDTKQRYDVMVFYNALQHFADLTSVAQKCHEVLALNGAIYLSEYLKVPTDEAHIQYLQKETLDDVFETADLKVHSVVKPVRLTGLVERPGGVPIDLYIAKLTH